MTSKVIEFRRNSLDKLIKELQEKGTEAEGVIMILLKPDGHAHFRISGFPGISGRWKILGLLDWLKFDLMGDFLR